MSITACSQKPFPIEIFSFFSFIPVCLPSIFFFSYVLLLLCFTLVLLSLLFRIFLQHICIVFFFREVQPLIWTWTCMPLRRLQLRACWILHCSWQTSHTWRLLLNRELDTGTVCKLVFAWPHLLLPQKNYLWCNFFFNCFNCILRYYVAVLTLISFSLALQIVAGVLIIIIGEHCILDILLEKSILYVF